MFYFEKDFITEQERLAVKQKVLDLKEYWDNYENNQKILHTTLHDLFIIDDKKDNEKDNEKNNKIINTKKN